MAYTTPTTRTTGTLITASIYNTDIVDNISYLYSKAAKQVLNTQDGTTQSTTTTIPHDSTIPQNTEGGQFMSLAITPTSSTSKLIIDVYAALSHGSASSYLMAALFQDSTANALAAGDGYAAAAGEVIGVSFRHYMTSGTTSSTTFKVRGGGNAAGTVTFNGYLGGVMASSITIMEI